MGKRDRHSGWIGRNSFLSICGRLVDTPAECTAKLGLAPPGCRLDVAILMSCFRSRCRRSPNSNRFYYRFQ